MLLPPLLRSLEARRLPSRAPPPALAPEAAAVGALEDRRLLATFVVNNPTDTPVTGQTDLRQAIGQANSTGGPKRLPSTRPSSPRPQTITLTGGQLELSDTSGTRRSRARRRA